jgi:hypothetical protein
MTYSNASAGASNQQIWLASNSTTTSYTGDGNSGVYIYGAQLSNSASLDPYVPTPGAAPSSTAYYGPRFDYDPVTLLPRGLLVEEARTNLTTFSEDVSSWGGNISVVVTSNAAVAPDGTTTADKVAPAASGSGFYAQPLTNIGSTGAYTGSVFLKASEISSNILVQLSTGSLWGGTNPAVTVNLLTGTITAPTNVSASSITPIGNGWYRVTLSQTATSTGTTGIRISPTGGTAGNGTSGIFVWGTSLEAGTFATSYIPTIASTVTRSADVATITGSLFSQWYNQSEGALVVNYNLIGLNPASNQEIITPLTDNNNYIGIGANNGVGTMFSTANTAGVSQGFLTVAGAAANVMRRQAVAYATNNSALCIDGGAVGVDTTYAVPSVTRLDLGSRLSSNYLNGHIRSIRYVPVRAADFQLQQVTT